jgi:hypothetical protein
LLSNKLTANQKTFNITLPNKHLPVVLPDRKEDEPLFDNLMTSVPPTASVASPNRDAIVKRVKPVSSHNTFVIEDMANKAA